MLNQSAHASLARALWEEGVVAQQFILFEIEGAYYLRASSGFHLSIDTDFQLELDESAFVLDSSDCITADGFLYCEAAEVILKVRNHPAFFEPVEGLLALQKEHCKILVL